MSTDEPTCVDGADLISVPGLDGSHLGIATGLLRAVADQDPDLRALVTQISTPGEVFVSCLELLLASATLASETMQEGEFDAGAAFLLSLAKGHPRPDLALFLCQVGMALLRDTEPHRLCVTPVSAFDVLDLCVAAAERIEDEHGISLTTQISLYSDWVLRQTATPVG